MSPRRERTVLPGTVELLILRMLSEEPLHGFAISRGLHARSDGAIDVQDAALYQALHRLAKEGLVEGEWGLSDNNRRARFYRLTKAGEVRLTTEERDFRHYIEGVFRVLGPTARASEPT
jgi:transcriptional regulator